MNDNEELNELLETKPINGKEPEISDISPIREEGEPKSPEIGYCQWSTADGKVFQPAHRTTDVLVPGVYEISANSSLGMFFQKVPIRTEGLMHLPDSNSNKVINEISTFWDRENIFKEYELIHKRGILLWGPPGSGKSCTIQLVMDDVVKRGGVVIRFTEPSLFMTGMRAFRDIQPETPAIVIMEDIDSIINMYCESHVLNILDGVNEVHKTVFLATTNYPHLLGGRIVNRPSRFDKRFKIDMPSHAARQMYFENMFERVDAKERERLAFDSEKWAIDMAGLSIAHLKELFVAVVVLGDDYHEAVNTLQTMKENIKEEKNNYVMGFSNDPMAYQEGSKA